MSINVSTRSYVTVYTLTIQFRIDEQPSHHDSENEGLVSLTSTMKISYRLSTIAGLDWTGLDLSGLGWKRSSVTQTAIA